ncbi:uncharacterized protein M437DRAFT_58738 [Aureobasidium melanogenum CBS 110374]|uniref:Uncharacterized protein n=1 Tax=Aureobasidium melanogenum (strain CBS 110374) TaxID=1043003 RepID=A0A074W875_AURM1|nr:uncharacterized protein M437DRAFT_58738 [Aureobasidium melanogenum CBS 110374]KEQ58751.1 hypothetical protein M437DRAFT_58738 [Aureobasidium melanogenum CBS 110374]
MSTSTISSARFTTPSCSSNPTQPIQIGFSSSSSTMGRPRNTSDASIVFGSPSPNGPAAFPSWKLARPQLPQGPASSYISDEDLFGDDEVAYLDEAPEPPRTAEQWMTSKRGMGMAANASLVTLDSSCESYNSFGFSNGYTPSKPIMMKK